MPSLLSSLLCFRVVDVRKVISRPYSSSGKDLQEGADNWGKTSAREFLSRLVVDTEMG